MERIPIRITALLAMTTLAACDFLDIDTPGIVNRDKMFENEQGFIDAMNGVYASMADADLYGEQLSFGFVDEIAQLYYNDYEANETTLTKTFDLRYRDEDVRPQIDAIWSKPTTRSPRPTACWTTSPDTTSQFCRASAAKR